MRSIFCCVLSVGLTILGAGAIGAQDYPYKPIRIITVPIGGPNDLIARLIAKEISGPLGQPVVVENRPQALTPEIVARATPDGYSLLFTGSFWLRPFLQKTPYDPLKDFAPITLATNSPDILVVNPSLPVTSIKELIALAKSKPGELNYTSGITGGSSHLEGELFKALAGVNIVRVGYQSTDPQIRALISSEAHMSFATPSGVTQFLKSGRLRGLAITSAQPSARYPELPTVAASLPGFETGTVLAVLAPAKTPVAIISRLNREIVRALNQPDIKEKLTSAGLDVVGTSPEALLTMMKSEMVRMGKVIKDAGIRAD